MEPITPGTETHLFIIWEKAYPARDRILADLQETFEIFEVREIVWSASFFPSNLTRFYGTKGLAEVNAKTFDAKSKYRAWTGGGHKIHATNSVQETWHDLVLLLGREADNYLGENPPRWSGSLALLKPQQRELFGCKGWGSLEDLFYALNATVDYMVLRNFEGFPETLFAAEHPDIDFLTAQQQEFVYVANASKHHLYPRRVMHKLQIGERTIPCDIRYRGDNYYDSAWQSELLSRRQLHADGFYVPSDEDYFYSLLYHGLIHKRLFADDYINRLLELSQAIGLADICQDTLRDRDRALGLLQRYLSDKAYEFTVPDDYSVVANKAGVAGIRGRLLPSIERRIVDVARVVHAHTIARGRKTSG